jgi:CRISPR/Cas system CSM-associated protein Csm3 (group 7 of RAMP superfamily)
MGIKLSSLKGKADSQFNTYVNSMDEKIKKFTEDIKVTTDDLNEKMDTEYKEINKNGSKSFHKAIKILLIKKNHI